MSIVLKHTKAISSILWHILFHWGDIRAIPMSDPRHRQNWVRLRLSHKSWNHSENTCLGRAMKNPSPQSMAVYGSLWHYGVWCLHVQLWDSGFRMAISGPGHRRTNLAQSTWATPRSVLMPNPTWQRGSFWLFKSETLASWTALHR